EATHSGKGSVLRVSNRLFPFLFVFPAGILPAVFAAATGLLPDSFLRNPMIVSESAPRSASGRSPACVRLSPMLPRDRILLPNDFVQGPRPAPPGKAYSVPLWLYGPILDHLYRHYPSLRKNRRSARPPGDQDPKYSDSKGKLTSEHPF